MGQLDDLNRKADERLEMFKRFSLQGLDNSGSWGIDWELVDRINETLMKAPMRPSSGRVQGFDAVQAKTWVEERYAVEDPLVTLFAEILALSDLLDSIFCLIEQGLEKRNRAKGDAEFQALYRLRLQFMINMN